MQKNLLRLKASILLIAIFSFLSKFSSGQSMAATRIYSNFGSTATVPALWYSPLAPGVYGANPNTSHDLLAFTWNGTTYATGVNNTLLNNNSTVDGLGSYTPTSFAALIPDEFDLNAAASKGGPFLVVLGSKNDGTTSSTKGSPNYYSGPSPVTVKGIETLSSPYDPAGHGLDLGSGFTNVPTSYSFVYNLNTNNTINTGAIEDGTPDLIFAQIAEASGTDNVYFVDANGIQVSAKVSINFTSNTSVLGNWTGDFFQLDGTLNPPTTIWQANSSRPLRLWAIELSSFFPTGGAYAPGPMTTGAARKIKIDKSGNNDPAFVAFNLASLSAPTVLPVTWSYFNVKPNGSSAILNWGTETETNTQSFDIERSSDGQSYTKIGTVAAAGNSTSLKEYSFTDPSLSNGTYYYRLNQIDLDGKSAYSAVKKITIDGISSVTAKAYPNPARDYVVVTASATSQVALFDISGKSYPVSAVIYDNTSKKISTQSLPSGNYIIRVVEKDGSVQNYKIAVIH